MKMQDAETPVRRWELRVATAVAIVGASGYGAAELVRLLSAHPALDVGVVASSSAAGQPLRDLHPHLDTDVVVEGVDVDALGATELVFLATPHAVSLELAPRLAAAGAKVVDMSGALRLDADGFRTWYGEPHPAPELAPAVYGLTEFTRDQVRSAQVVANPGCYPTAALLALLPIAGLIRGAIVVDAKSGTSGAGASPSAALHHPRVHGDVAAYGAPVHRHTGEIEDQLGRLGDHHEPISFTPHLLPMARGLLATCYAQLRPEVGPEGIAATYRARYDDEPFVRALEPGVFAHTGWTTGSNACVIGHVVDERTQRVVVTSVIDNLGKGAAGQAIQNANLMLGLDEGAGLSATGVAP